ETTARPSLNPPPLNEVTLEGECFNDSTCDYTNRPRLAEPRWVLRPNMKRENDGSGDVGHEKIGHNFEDAVMFARHGPRKIDMRAEISYAPVLTAAKSRFATGAGR